jgi:hypothetical protein
VATATIQRAMKFELQTRNIVWRRRGARRSKLPRKFGPKQKFGKKWEDIPLHKGKQGKAATAKKEGTAVELQSESGGFVEFETPKWFNSWCALKKRIKEAVELVKDISKAPKVGTSPDGYDLVEFPFDVSHLKRTRRFKQGLRSGETLEVELRDPDWWAKIQPSESLELGQFESYLTEHGHGPWATEAITKAKELVRDANTEGTPDAELGNLRSFLQLIITYIQNAQHDWEYEEKQAAKEYLSIMARTSFSSMYRELLSAREQKLFDRIVRDRAVLKKMGLTRRSRFYAHGVHGPLKKLTVHEWLKSIPRAGRKRVRRGKEESRSQKDLLSLPRGGSAAMGRFDVETEPGEDETMLVRLEARATRQGQTKKAVDWVAYAEERFKKAATARGRTGKSTAMEYEPGDCP